MVALSVFKSAICNAADCAEEEMKRRIAERRAKFESDEAFYADPHALCDLQENEARTTAAKEAAATYGLSPADGEFIACLLSVMWNDVLEWVGK